MGPMEPKWNPNKTHINTIVFVCFFVWSIGFMF